MNELKKLIMIIEKEHVNITKKWRECGKYFPINMKKKQVIDLLKDKDLYEAVLDYHSFIFDLYPILSQKFNICEKVFSRVKNLNSLQSKIIKYIE